VSALEVVVAHSVSAAPGPGFGPRAGYAVEPGALRAFLESRRDRRRASVPECLTGERGPEGALLLTFDDAYRDFRSAALPVLEETGTPAVLFVVTDLADGAPGLFEHRLAALIGCLDTVRLPDGRAQPAPDAAAKQRVYRALYLAHRRRPPAGRDAALAALLEANGLAAEPAAPDVFLSWDELRALDAHPLVTIGSHSRSHPLLTSLPRGAVRAEVAASKQRLEAELGHPVECFSYPYGGHSFAVRRAVRAAGYRFAFTTRPRPVRGRLRPYAIPRIDIGSPELRPA
jgi:peptidoglycan/xylan/chitin deacetylase (PgdA/CDA1 family)